eukprot:CAMPEP_0115764782 /NCGR_PEP_ID=MMETSP0272-20121206/102241_1 /TAXON_ID=71861 /ORGANISM="Scrippsiella trochoidea, Strain CCMP3099" /LENGTH=76 /DNA_ID=CAMNT_0003210587 /DNA_START=23 /DNA_END=250 /DNA_ORIENTATION=-
MVVHVLLLCDVVEHAHEHEGSDSDPWLEHRYSSGRRDAKDFGPSLFGASPNSSSTTSATFEAMSRAPASGMSRKSP